MPIEIELYEVYEMSAAVLFFLITTSLVIFAYDDDALREQLLVKEVELVGELMVDEKTTIIIQQEDANNYNQLTTLKLPNKQVSVSQDQITITS